MTDPKLECPTCGRHDPLRELLITEEEKQAATQILALLEPLAFWERLRIFEQLAAKYGTGRNP